MISFCCKITFKRKDSSILRFLKKYTSVEFFFAVIISKYAYILSLLSQS